MTKLVVLIGLGIISLAQASPVVASQKSIENGKKCTTYLHADGSISFSKSCPVHQGGK